MVRFLFIMIGYKDYPCKCFILFYTSTIIMLYLSENRKPMPYILW